MRKGLTLIEVIISIALMGIVLVSVLSIFDTGLFNIKRAGDRTDVVVEVKSQVDNLLSGGKDLVDQTKYELIEDPIESQMQVGFIGSGGISHTFAAEEFTSYKVLNRDDRNKDIWVELDIIEKTPE
jgi:prepilin-type N-terminal cleavage/methylation domain-containing protein